MLCCPCRVTQYCVYAKTEVNRHTVLTEKAPQVVNTDAECWSVPTKKKKKKRVFLKDPRLYICKTWQISLGSQLLYDKSLRRFRLDSFGSLEKLKFELISGCELENLIKIWASYLSPVMLHCSGFLIFLSLKQSCIISQTLLACVRTITVTLLNGPLGADSFFFFFFLMEHSVWSILELLQHFVRFAIICLLAD